MKKITIIIVLLAVICGGIYYYQVRNGVISDYPVPSQTPDSEIKSESISISDWKTYHNNEYRFTIKYPPTWPVDFSNDIVTIGTTSPDPIDKYTTCYMTITFQGNRDGGSFIPAPHKYSKYQISEIKRGEVCDNTLGEITKSFKLEE